MYEEGKKLLKEISERGPDYEAMVTRLSWWQTVSEGRVFVVLDITLTKNAGSDDTSQYLAKCYPDLVWLLQYGKSETTRVPWSDFIAGIEKGSIISLKEE